MAENKNGNAGMEQEEQQRDTVTVMLDDGTELECVVLMIFEAGDGEYIALLPEETADEQESTVFLYRYFEDENGEPQLDNIETDEEYDTVSAAFNEIITENGDEDIIDEEEAKNM
ncbi:Protein of unknown function [[Clostridium] aminophilum]|uniref:Uncharacterized protein n=1 Tax=[Clostridium] aminophilum TaxID=1526 RepID=A0A1I0ESA9_9FIRM|nr:DUF1292 domain-containing protein [[Clostridium] aminophilum]SET48120.1 Protein of unknown function [[Clostridium] aminophilum]